MLHNGLGRWLIIMVSNSIAIPSFLTVRASSNIITIDTIIYQSVYTTYTVFKLFSIQYAKHTVYKSYSTQYI